jgi:epsilon-lactone hydrolase
MNRELTAHAGPHLAADGTLNVRAFTLPISSLLEEESQSLLHSWMRRWAAAASKCPGSWSEDRAIPAVREFFAAQYAPILATFKALYPVRIEPVSIGGVYTEVLELAEGVPSHNRQRVLINLHGGGFTVGARYIGQIESIPIAALGGFKVVSVDYRMAPEYQFPAASEDVASVYRALLRDYSPENIGIYGSSAGAVLTAQTVAWLQKEKLPRPGAVGMLCAAGSFWTQGDSGYIAPALDGESRGSPQEHPYFRNADPSDPLVFPAVSSAVMAQFPASLLVSATRDCALSSVVHMHSRLVALGVAAQLHVWEGLGHGFFFDAGLPHSKEAHEVTCRFFHHYLGGR